MFRNEAVLLLALYAAPLILGPFAGIVLLLGGAAVLTWIVASRVRRVGSTDPATATAGAAAPGVRVFSPRVTGLAAIVVAVAVVAGAWLLYATPRREGAVSAEALSVVVGRTLDLRDAVADASGWERRVYEALAGDAADELRQAIAWYEELEAESPEAPVEAPLLVLLGEAGQAERLSDRLVAHGSGLHEVIRIAYLGPAAEAAGRRFDYERAAALPEGWFADRLARQWARQAGDAGLLAAAQESARARTRPLLVRFRVLAGVYALAFVAGVAALVIALRRRLRGHDALVAGGAPLPPPWSGWTGVVVLVRGGAITVLALATLFVGSELVAVPSPATYLFAAAYVLAFAPALLLAERRLLRPAGLTSGAAFGLRVPPGRRGRLALVGLAALGLGRLGDMVITLGADALHLESHWTESWDSDLVWGTPTDATVMLLVMVVLAPFLEESVFRGLVFATLRRRWRLGAAALASGVLFAGGHGYGLAGSASILLDGLVLAWAYESSRSLVPGMLAHATHNALSALALILLLRS
jgi:membrane protease YdiL (CAAX protease family)